MNHTMLDQLRSEMKNYWGISIKISLLSIFFPHVEKTQFSTLYGFPFKFLRIPKMLHAIKPNQSLLTSIGLPVIPFVLNVIAINISIVLLVWISDKLYYFYQDYKFNNSDKT